MKLKVKENNNASILCNVRDGNSDIQNMTGWTFVFVVERDNGSVVLSKSTSNPAEILITDAPGGKVSVFILPVDTDEKAGQYKFEFKGTDPGSATFTLDEGEFIIAPTII